MIKNILSFLTGVLLTFFVFIFFSLTVKNSDEILISKDFLSVIGEISHIVDEYKKPTDVSETQEALFKTFVSSYEDPYTSYISKEEFVTFNTMINGDFEGIGAYIEDSSNGVFVQ